MLAHESLERPNLAQLSASGGSRHRILHSICRDTEDAGKETHINTAHGNNPYAPPQNRDVPAARTLSRRSSLRTVPLVLLAVSVTAGITYTIGDEVIFKTAYGAWPMLFGACALAIIVGAVTRDTLIAPLCCLLPVIAGDLLAGSIRGWHYAQFHLCLPLALAFSVPALLTTGGLNWLRNRRARELTQAAAEDPG